MGGKAELRLLVNDHTSSSHVLDGFAVDALSTGRTSGLTAQRASSVPQRSVPESTDLLRVAIVGTGYVGLTTGACFAHLGFEVVCCDIDASKIAMLEAGQVPILERDLPEIVADARRRGLLSFSLGVDPVIRDADVVFLCVPTPQGGDGSADLSLVRTAAAEIGPLLKSGAVVVNKSTVPVGSFRVVGDALGRDDVSVASNPEFLREGSAVHDFLNPDRVVIGAQSDEAARAVACLYESIDTEVVMTDPSSAELIKYAANGFLAMKLSFVNSLAALCEQVGADIDSVVEGIGSDRRIGKSFLAPGPGWGGSCFPKDSRALIAISDQHDYDFTLMREVVEANEHQYDRMVEKVLRAGGRRSGGRLDGLVVGVLGLTFKAHTDDLRESPSLHVIDRLQRLGAVVQAYDPTTSGPIGPDTAARLDGIRLAATALDAVADTDVVIVLTEWPEFSELDLDKVAEAMSGDAVVDCRNLFDGAVVRSAGMRYEGIGRS